MGIGTSGRVVIEIEPKMKRELYSLLAIDGLTLKQWFLREVSEYLGDTEEDNSDRERLKEIENGNKKIDA